MLGPMAYVPTRWSVVAAASGDSGEARAALAWLCERYWDPLVAHATRRGWRPQSAEDLVQELFADLLRRGDLARADPARGRFRTWLCTCLDHLASKQREHGAALKRGGGAGTVAPDSADIGVAAADPGFDRDWALAVLGRAGDRLANEEAAAGRGERHATLAPLLATASPEERSAAAAALGLGDGALRVALHRLRERLRDLVREEVTATLADPTPEAVADEWEALRQALGGSGAGGR
jgi:DNA-directed RNA polymerase specialized sigma24 family protein